MLEPAASHDEEAQGSPKHERKSTIALHISTAVGELLGTAMFLFLAEGAAKTANLGRTASQQGAQASLDNSTILTIATSFGLSLIVTAWIFFRITGGLFNPAITFALWLVGVLTAVRAITLFFAQIVGGILAAALVLALTPKMEGSSSGVDLVNNDLTGVSIAQGFFLEAIGTSILVFTVLLLAVEKHRATFLAPIGIGLALFAIHLFLLPWTGCAVNPARAFGPAVVSGNFPSIHWIFWIAPLFGSMLAVLYFEVLKAFEYNRAVLAIDSEKETTVLTPVHKRIFNKGKNAVKTAL